ncbi:MAG: hypothetical protein F6K22_24575 [Okeania sp. SIO2F4]|nr:hypothetical protein [Okeania sp. SIO2F4]NES05707.1 hypothetical protein [Okeania sp. SIO2F4]
MILASGFNNQVITNKDVFISSLNQLVNISTVILGVNLFEFDPTFQ